jgi:hypothetical protein
MQARISLFNRKLLLPVLPVAIFEEHGDGRTNCLSVTYTREDSGGIALDFHPAAAAVTLLPAPQFVINKVLRDFKSSGEAGNKGNQRFAVRLSRGEEFQHPLGLYPMSNVADEMGKPATRLVHPRVGYACSASKVNTVQARPIGDGARVSFCFNGQPRTAILRGKFRALQF